MAQLRTLDQVGEEREKLYTKLDAGKISEQRAVAGERLLTGQQKLLELPMKMLQMFTRLKSIADESRQRAVLDLMMRNMMGTQPKQLEK